jgi:hypothetical protein
LQPDLAAMVAKELRPTPEVALTHLLYTLFLSTLLAIRGRALDSMSPSPYLRHGAWHSFNTSAKYLRNNTKLFFHHNGRRLRAATEGDHGKTEIPPVA